VLTAVLFASVFALVKPLSAGTLFAVFILMMALNWILSLRLLRSWQFNKR
jgi:F0F1-type ATP synthase assembly protein I